MEKEPESNIKIYLKTIENLRALKIKLNLKSIKDTIVLLYDAYMGQPQNTETAITRAEIRDTQAHIIEMCQAIREKLDEDSRLMRERLDNQVLNVNIEKLIGQLDVKSGETSDMRDAVSKALLDAITDVQNSHQ